MHVTIPVFAPSNLPVLLFLRLIYTLLPAPMFKFRPSFNCIRFETQFYFLRVKILNFLSLPYLGWVSCYHDILAGRVSALFHRERSGREVTETLTHLNVLCIHALHLPICLSFLTRYWALETQWWNEEHSHWTAVWKFTWQYSHPTTLLPPSGTVCSPDANTLSENKAAWMDHTFLPPPGQLLWVCSTHPSAELRSRRSQSTVKKPKRFE